MKIRKDFVTNSSSASFVLGKADDVQMTIETTYQLIRQIYLDVLSIFRKAVEDNVDVLDGAGIKVVFGIDYCFKMVYRSGKGFMGFDSLTTFDKVIGDELDGIEYAGNTDFNWLDCATYEDYLNYFEGKIQPFEILDLSKDFGTYWDVGDTIEYYDTDVDPTYLGSLYFDCDCEHCLVECDAHFAGDGWCDENAAKMMERCKTWREKQKNGTAENHILQQFGRILILSNAEDYMPLPVHKRLKAISNYGCWHMG